MCSHAGAALVGERATLGYGLLAAASARVGSASRAPPESARRAYAVARSRVALRSVRVASFGGAEPRRRHPARSCRRRDVSEFFTKSSLSEHIKQAYPFANGSPSAPCPDRSFLLRQPTVTSEYISYLEFIDRKTEQPRFVPDFISGSDTVLDLDPDQAFDSNAESTLDFDSGRVPNFSSGSGTWFCSTPRIQF
ncbi:hypothetical protein EVAR_83863_1 [Eumeta japonica]|uniref:Uncharacterized protein n=1 Tax=Eumeta variegata TaxID=151549 RepID=A0A4C1UT17_EUMVA|nr:hypothetical protein EVAR_83863_1 [Eumeta japonica]